MVVITQQLFVFLLKMTILWCFGGTTIVGNSLCIGKKMRVQKLGQAFLLQKGIIFDIFWGELARSSPRKIPIRISASLGRYTIFYRVCKKKCPSLGFQPTAI